MLEDKPLLDDKLRLPNTSNSIDSITDTETRLLPASLAYLLDQNLLEFFMSGNPCSGHFVSAISVC